MTVRVRIAPAPSGSLHIGNARTALYNWLFARHHRGAFVLRIEDTDQTRVKEEFVQLLIDEMRWLGLDYDEGPDVGGPFAPYRESERLETYREAGDRLAEDGFVYRCYCTPEELKQRREGALAEGRKPGYDGRCFRLSDAERQGFEAEGRRWVLRFHVPDEGETTYEDLILGPVTVEYSEIEDFPILRQNGFPLYVMGAAVDDALMEITHVIRGMDLQSAAPRQVLLLGALGHEPPRYGHIPLVLGQGGKPLSKRYGGGSVEWYRDRGFLPEAVINSLALLGTGFGDETILSRDEMVEHFSLDKVHASPAALNEEKLDWMNGEYIRMLDVADLADRLEPWLVGAGVVGDPPSASEHERIRQVVPLAQTRIKRLEEAVPYARPLFSEEVELDPASFEKVMREPHVAELLDEALAALRALDPWGRDGVEGALRKIQEGMGLKPKTAFLPFYVAITGSRVGLPIFDSMEILGREKSLERLARARAALG